MICLVQGLLLVQAELQPGQDAAEKHPEDDSRLSSALRFSGERSGPGSLPGCLCPGFFPMALHFQPSCTSAPSPIPGLQLEAFPPGR